MKRIITLFSLVLALIIISTTCALAGGAKTTNIPGDYAVIETDYCVQTVDNDGYFDRFNGYQLISTAGGSVRLINFSGVLSLWGDGAGTLVSEYFIIWNNPVDQGFPIEQGQWSCDVAWGLFSDGTIIFELKNCGWTESIGRAPGMTFSVDNNIALLARQSPDTNTLVFSGMVNDVRIESIRWTGGGGPQTRQRICTRTGTAIRMPK